MPRRLTNLEYRNSLRDLFDVALPENLKLPKEEETLGFDNNARALQVTPLHTERLMLSSGCGSACGSGPRANYALHG